MLIIILNMLTNLILVCSLITNIFPPLGNQYGKVISIPVLGKQEILSKVISENTVSINLKGIVNQNGTIKYLKNDDKELIVLSYNLRNTLKILQVDFGAPEYDIKRDRVLFRLKIKPVFYSKNIVLDRMISCNSNQ